mmetsp:Transcript_35026/g.88260  ORF Transcript_35026/g.88260 Transcript_35026/m.88260 type:complete len:202 (+) Transcript_35026:2080-2685(+)
MCSQATLCHEGSQHRDDQGLALTCPDSSQHGLGQPSRARANTPGSSRSDGKHEERNHLCVMREHEDVVSLPHRLSSCPSDLKHTLPIRGLEGNSAPNDPPLERRGHSPDDIRNVRVRSEALGTVASQWQSVDSPHALQQLLQGLALLASALCLELVVRQLEILFPHILQSEDDCVKGAEGRCPTIREGLLQERLDSPLGPL